MGMKTRIDESARFRVARNKSSKDRHFYKQAKEGLRYYAEECLPLKCSSSRQLAVRIQELPEDFSESISADLEVSPVVCRLTESLMRMSCARRSRRRERVGQWIDVPWRSIPPRRRDHLLG